MAAWGERVYSATEKVCLISYTLPLEETTPLFAQQNTVDYMLSGCVEWRKEGSIFEGLTEVLRVILPH